MQNSELQGYLNKYFPKGKTGFWQGYDVDIEAHFLSRFGVQVKQEENLFLFKYTQIGANWKFGITKECRGIILRYYPDKQEWKIVSRPFDKFFNSHEVYCEYYSDKKFDKFCTEFLLTEKADGSLIQVWLDKDGWRASTSGAITPTIIEPYSETFDEVFWSLTGNFKYLLKPGFTYLFELCSRKNQVVTQYPTDLIYLLGIRNNDTGLYLDSYQVDEFMLKLYEYDDRLRTIITRPYIYQAGCEGLTTKEQVIEWIEKESKSNKYGKNPEGFVVWHNNEPKIKMKNTNYITLHHVLTGGFAHAINMVIEHFFAEKINDIYDDLTEEAQKYVETLREKVRILFAEIEEEIKKIENKNYENQKEYALEVQKAIDKNYHVFFFAYKDKILEHKGVEMIDRWIKDYYKKFMDIWKEIK